MQVMWHLYPEFVVIFTLQLLLITDMAEDLSQNQSLGEAAVKQVYNTISIRLSEAEAIPLGV